MERTLFTLIDSLGPGRPPRLGIWNNNGPKARPDFCEYIVYVEGGVQFEITRHGDQYHFNPIWTGPYNVNNAEKVLEILVYLGYGPITVAGKTVIHFNKIRP